MYGDKIADLRACCSAAVISGSGAWGACGTRKTCEELVSFHGTPETVAQIDRAKLVRQLCDHRRDGALPVFVERREHVDILN